MARVLLLVALGLAVSFVPWTGRVGRVPLVARRSLAGSPGLQKAKFMGKWVEYNPVMQEASKAEETGGEMPLGIRFQLTEEGHYVISEIISGGSASRGTLEVSVGNIIHAVSCEVEGRKDIALASQMSTIDQMTQAFSLL